MYALFGIFAIYVNILPLQSLSRDVSTEGITDRGLKFYALPAVGAKSLLRRASVDRDGVIHLGRSSQAWIEGVSVRPILASAGLLAAR